VLFILYVCETWSPILNEEHNPRVFEERGVREISKLQREGVREDWRKLHNEKLHGLYCSLFDDQKE